MSIMIVGAGRLGLYLAQLMKERQEKVVVVEKDESKMDKLRKELNCEVVVGDGCNSDVLKKAGIIGTDIVVAATGHDEDNLIICQLAKYEFGVSRVVSRINNPKNDWLFTKDMGVDAAVSSARIIARLIEEEAEISGITTIINLSEGKISIVRSIIERGSNAANKMIKDLMLPKNCVIMSVIRNNKVLLPDGSTYILPGDEVLSVVSDESKETLKNIFDAE
ncbi:MULTISPECIES: potassium channel family protein [Thermoanaerobacterium]|uniref:Trk system potassium uptake protein TrkA n=2 Tax=Thermoanaerobacterium TaxID=28895 RepID=W9EBC0_9THEO|nr:MULTISPECIES: TrkA family potassium uptake protein [Thermoanaerobacterium]AFK87339.1 TrkA-N domain protein [Thermoanaerobacterium saccharolyticum JW/SL-YS485]ETO37094.1 TrkA-N domain-containing protein [Thermoanaerobacterium aotearoense SCUT27]